MSEASTINKLILLYLLDQVSFPLSGSQISEYIVSKGYMQYFAMQELFSELEASSLISVTREANTTFYQITDEGHQTISFFSNRLTVTLRDEIRTYLRDNHLALKEGAAVRATYDRTNAGDYAVHAIIKEDDSTLLDLTVSVPSEDEADAFVLRWPDRAQQIYAEIMKLLMK